MTTEDIAIAIMDLSLEEMDEVMEIIYESVDTEAFNEELLSVGINVERWCKKKHPPAG